MTTQAQSTCGDSLEIQKLHWSRFQTKLTKIHNLKGLYFKVYNKRDFAKVEMAMNSCTTLSEAVEMAPRICRIETLEVMQDSCSTLAQIAMFSMDGKNQFVEVKRELILDFELIFFNFL